ncbi:MAG: MogA/MoaB family molybdenum cofactor biosynthesis protein [Candidatus Binatia bacterium]|nr:MogA/MoaB family molybdenum cofactor biosynthesis protein [Candidatus Binatia bacterium]
MAHGDSHKHGDPVQQHKAAGKRTVRCLVVTVSDTRTMDDDKSGATAKKCLLAAGHDVVRREIVKDERQAIVAVLREAIADDVTDAVLLTGGTGVAPRDVTFEAVQEALEKPLDGFGEIFRTLSYEEIGSAAMLSRAIGGVTGRTAVFALPGSTKAVRLGIDKLIGPELGHILGLIAP